MSKENLFSAVITESRMNPNVNADGDVVSFHVIEGGITKLEWATVMIMAGLVANSNCAIDARDDVAFKARKFAQACLD